MTGLAQDASTLVVLSTPEEPKLQPVALKDALALIEALFPPQKVSFEA